jgi:hypothetical protein
MEAWRPQYCLVGKGQGTMVPSSSWRRDVGCNQGRFQGAERVIRVEDCRHWDRQCLYFAGFELGQATGAPPATR